MNTIFLAGVHGVGKSHIAVSIAKTLGFGHFGASQLIREEREKISWTSDKKTSNLDSNQQILINALVKKRLTHSDILLDGHFVLRNEQNILVPLDLEVFRKLQLTGVILLTEDETVIMDRLRQRDGTHMAIDDINKLTIAELNHARKVCSELCLPLDVIHSPDEMKVFKSIKNLSNF